MDSAELRSLATTARRAGLRRSLARVRRLLLLRVVNPRFASRLYPCKPLARGAPLGLIPIPVSARGPSAWNDCVSLLNSPPFAVRPPVDWDANPLGHMLWAFELHQFEWAWPLVNRAAGGDQAAADALLALLRDYVARVPIGKGIGWEPYPLSRRLVVWAAAASALDVARHGAEAVEIAERVDEGARLLAANLERDLDNNHVIANARALAYAGTLLRSPSLPRYGRKGYDLLWSQLEAQVRRDGGHIEQSTSYHLLVWRDGLETALLARASGLPIPPHIPPLLVRMRDWLLALRRPDGSFPLLCDSVEEPFTAFDALSLATDSLAGIQSDPSRAIPGSSSVIADSGYAVLRCGETWVLFDAGPFGAAFCPGHGHADALSFELWTEGELLIADPGVERYQAGPWRDYFRGSRAHSTLVVDGRDQTEMSSSFRVGRMARAQIVDAQSDRSPLFVRGEHNGYTALASPLMHRRSLALQHGRKLVVQDEVEGTGVHDFELRFHLAPGAHASPGHDGAVARFGDLRLEFRFTGPSSAQACVEEGWYGGSWYRRLSAPVVCYKWRGSAPCMVSTTLTISTGA